MTIDWNVKISLAEAIRIVVLLAAIIGAWYKLDLRLSLVEQHQADTQQLMQRVSGSVEQIERYLSSQNPDYWWRSKAGQSP